MSATGQPSILHHVGRPLGHISDSNRTSEGSLVGPQESELPLESHAASGDLSLSGWGIGILNMPTLSGLGCLCTAGTVLAWKLDSERVSWKQPGP